MIINNARIILPEKIVESGSIFIKNKLIENIEEIEELIHLVDELINSDDHKSDKISSLSEEYSVKLAKISYLLDLLKLQHLSDKSDLKEYILEHNKYIIEKLDKIKNSLHLNNGHFPKIFKEEVSSIFHYLHKNK